MSDWRSISIVTESLRTLLDKGLKTELGSGNVTAKPPDKARENNNNSNQVNLFLYQISFNSHRRNMDFPQRGRKAETKNPPLALDLRYLITAYAAGNDETIAHRLLGRVMSVMHDHTALTSEDLVKPPEMSGEFIPQVESLRIVPQPLSLDEVSKMWTAFQTPFRISAAYEISAVLVDSKVSRKVALPVRAYNIYALQLHRPFIEEVSPHAAMPGTRLVIEGKNLKGEKTAIRIGSGTESILITPEILSDRQLEVTLPENLVAGVNTVQIAHDLMIGTPPFTHPLLESNIAAFVLIPKILEAPQVVHQGTSLTIRVAPKVGRQQRVSLLLGDQPIDIPPRSPTGPITSDELEFPIASDFPVDHYLLRLQVDGAESPLEIDNVSASPTQQYIGPMVSVEHE
jgi:hypothetical protein